MWWGHSASSTLIQRKSGRSDSHRTPVKRSMSGHLSAGSGLFADSHCDTALGVIPRADASDDAPPARSQAILIASMLAMLPHMAARRNCIFANTECKCAIAMLLTRRDSVATVAAQQSQQEQRWTE